MPLRGATGNAVLPSSCRASHGMSPAIRHACHLTVHKCDHDVKLAERNAHRTRACAHSPLRVS